MKFFAKIFNFFNIKNLKKKDVVSPKKRLRATLRTELAEAREARAAARKKTS